jgi:large subunit ribosomal protein L15
VSDELNLSNLKPAQARKARKRVGRGLGSGKGRYSGRGIKGQKSRSGSHKMPVGFEGGQMPIDMRVGKLRGNTSADAMPIGPFRTYSQPVNVRSLEERFAEGADVTPETLKAAGLIAKLSVDVKVLGGRAHEEALGHRAHVLEDGRREDRGRRRHGHAPPRAGRAQEEEAQGEAEADGAGRRSGRARGRGCHRGRRGAGDLRAARGRGVTRVQLARERLASS